MQMKFQCKCIPTIHTESVHLNTNSYAASEKKNKQKKHGHCRIKVCA